MFCTLVLAHVIMIEPVARGYKENLYNKKHDSIDYSLSGPLNERKTFPCGNYKRIQPSTNVLKAGNSVTVTLQGAFHNGGHCEFSLCKRDCKTRKDFKVIHRVLYTCPLAGSYQVPIPRSIQNGHYTFAWTWINHVGNREFYMNCADVKIIGGNAKRLKGPPITIRNLPGYPIYPEMQPMTYAPYSRLRQ